MPRPTTKAQLSQRAHYHYLANVVTDLDSHIRHGLTGPGFIPAEWTAIAQTRPESRKVKLSVRVDEDVVKFFRLMGVNYLARMNEVLRAFMHARLAEVVPGAESVEYRPNGQELYFRLFEEYIEKLMRRGLRARRGEVDDEAEIEMRQMLRVLRQMQDDLKLPEEYCFVTEAFLDQYYGVGEEDAPSKGSG